MTRKITKEIRLQRWLEDLQSFKESGLPENKWCEINGIKNSTFRYRCRIVENEILQRQITNTTPSTEIVQVPIEKIQDDILPEDHFASDNIVVELSSAKITMPSSVSPEQISALLQAVSNV